MNYALTRKYPDPDKVWAFTVARLTLGTITILGNGMLVAIFLRFKHFRETFSHWLIAMLAFTDLVNGIGLIMRVAASGLTVLSDGIYDSHACATVGSFQFIGTTSSNVILAAMAFDRLAAVTKPIAYNHIDITKYASLVVVVTFLSSGGVLYVIYVTMPSDVTVQCTIGAIIAPWVFVTCFVIFINCNAAMYLSYLLALRALHHRFRTTQEQHAIVAQQSVFTSVQILLILNAIFVLVPWITGMSVTLTMRDPEISGIISVIIGMGSDVNSCCGVFIYFKKKRDIRHYIIRLFVPKFMQRGIFLFSGPGGSTRKVVGVSVVQQKFNNNQTTFLGPTLTAGRP